MWFVCRILAEGLYCLDKKQNGGNPKKTDGQNLTASYVVWLVDFFYQFGNFLLIRTLLGKTSR